MTKKPPTFSVDGLIVTKLISNVRQKSYLTSTLNSSVQLSLMLCACTGNSSGKNLTALADEFAKLCGILVVDKCNLICTEDTYLFSLRTHSGACGTSILSHLMKSSN